MRSILHVDFDSFFASCEQHFNPNLRGKPIGITAQNGRNCVIAASREAKKMGVKSPNTTWEAKRICPDIIFVKADFERYLEITKKLIEIANSYSPVVEVFSLDEVFIDLTPVKNLYPKPILVAEEFKRKMQEQVGETITVSIGSSHNKLLAKLATGLNKPDGYAEINHENREKVFAQIELDDICGIGHGFKRRLNMIGIFTFRELASFPMHLLKSEFGNVASQKLKSMSLGIDDSPVTSYLEDTVTKSVGRNYCLPENEHDKSRILQTIYELSEEIAIKLRRIKMKGRTIGLYVHGDQVIGERKTIQKYTNLSEDIFDICLKIFNKSNIGYGRQIGIWISNLVDERYATMSLFDNPQKEIVTRVIDKINDRFGHHTIRNGYVLSSPQLHTKPNGFLADKWQRKELQAI